MSAPYRDLLVEVHDWRAERKAENIRFYAQAIADGRVRTLDREFTTRSANCDCCLRKHKPGLRVLFLTGPGCHKFQACASCVTEIVQAVPMQQLVITLQAVV